jgi:hypothetical protein
LTSYYSSLDLISQSSHSFYLTILQVNPKDL